MIDIKFGKRKVVSYRGARMVVGGLTTRNKIDILLYISREMAIASTEADLFGRVIELCQEIFEADNIHIRSYEATSGLLLPLRFLKASGPPARPLQPGEGFSGTAFQGRKTIFVADLSEKPEFIDFGERTRSVICCPIMAREAALGTVSIEKEIPYFYREDDVEILEALAAQMALALHEVRLVEGLNEARRRIESDLKLGRAVQSHIIQQKLDPWNGIHFFCHYAPMVEVSGDYLNVFRQGKNVTAVIADVSGHGVGAALVTMALHHHLGQCMEVATSLPDLIYEINQRIMPNLPDGVYFTMQIIRLYQDFTYSFVSAGHPKLMHFNLENGACRALDSTGLPCGLVDVRRSDYQEQFGKLEPGDFLVLLTDGFAEQRNGAGQQFTPERIIAAFQAEREVLLEKGGGALASDLGSGFLARFAEHSRDVLAEDDLTLLILQRSTETQSAEILYEKARRASGQTAFALAREAYMREPSYLKNIYFMAVILFRNKEYEPAVELLKEYILYGGESGDRVLYMLGSCLYQLGRLDEAKVHFKKSLSANHGLAEAALMLARIYLKEKRPRRALKIVETAYGYNPGHVRLKEALHKLRKAA